MAGYDSVCASARLSDTLVRTVGTLFTFSVTYEASCCEPLTGNSVPLSNLATCGAVLDWFRRGIFIIEKSTLSSTETGESFPRLFIQVFFGFTVFPDRTATKKLGWGIKVDSGISLLSLGLITYTTFACHIGALHILFHMVYGSLHPINHCFNTL